MKKMSAFVCAALLGVAGAASAGTVLIDNGDDWTTAVGTVKTGTTWNITNPATGGSDGGAYADLTYNYNAAAVWVHNVNVYKTYSYMIIQDIEALQFDLKIDNPDPTWWLSIDLGDRFLYYVQCNTNNVMATGTGGVWQTFTVPLSAMMKNANKQSALPVNLRHFIRLNVNLQNQAPTTGSGSVNIKIDNVRYITGTGALDETNLENFESYTDSSSLAAAWVPQSSGITVNYTDTDGFSSSKALVANVTFNAQNDLVLAKRTLPSALDITSAKYFKMHLWGDAAFYDNTVSPAINYAVDARLYLVDGSGNRIFAKMPSYTRVPAWADYFMLFGGGNATNNTWFEDPANSANCNRTDIREMWLGFLPTGTSASNTYPISGSLRIDNIRLGDDTVVASVSDWTMY